MTNVVKNPDIIIKKRYNFIVKLVYRKYGLRPPFKCAFLKLNYTDENKSYYLLYYIGINKNEINFLNKVVDKHPFLWFYNMKHQEFQKRLNVNNVTLDFINSNGISTKPSKNINVNQRVDINNIYQMVKVNYNSFNRNIPERYSFNFIQHPLHITANNDLHLLEQDFCDGRTGKFYVSINDVNIFNKMENLKYDVDILQQIDRKDNFLTNNVTPTNKYLYGYMLCDEKLGRGKFIKCANGYSILGEKIECVPNKCYGREVDYQFLSPENNREYFKCNKFGIPIKHKCPHGQIHNGVKCIENGICFDKQDGDRIRIDATHYIECFKNRDKFQSCSPNYILSNHKVECISKFCENFDTLERNNSEKEKILYASLELNNYLSKKYPIGNIKCDENLSNPEILNCFDNNNINANHSIYSYSLYENSQNFITIDVIMPNTVYNKETGKCSTKLNDKFEHILYPIYPKIGYFNKIYDNIIIDLAIEPHSASKFENFLDKYEKKDILPINSNKIFQNIYNNDADESSAKMEFDKMEDLPKRIKYDIVHNSNKLNKKIYQLFNDVSKIVFNMDKIQLMKDENSNFQLGKTIVVSQQGFNGQSVASGAIVVDVFSIIPKNNKLYEIENSDDIIQNCYALGEIKEPHIIISNELYTIRGENDTYLSKYISKDLYKSSLNLIGLRVFKREDIQFTLLGNIIVEYLSNSDEIIPMSMNEKCKNLNLGKIHGIVIYNKKEKCWCSYDGKVIDVPPAKLNYGFSQTTIESLNNSQYEEFNVAPMWLDVENNKVKNNITGKYYGINSYNTLFYKPNEIILKNKI